jgi:hypothetical protein
VRWDVFERETIPETGSGGSAVGRELRDVWAFFRSWCMRFLSWEENDFLGVEPIGDGRPGKRKTKF